MSEPLCVRSWLAAMQGEEVMLPDGRVVLADWLVLVIGQDGTGGLDDDEAWTLTMHDYQPIAEATEADLDGAVIGDALEALAAECGCAVVPLQGGETGEA